MSGKKRYRILNGLDYDGKRAEVGAVVDDLPPKSIKWLLDRGHIELSKKGDD